jgi:hypothetical protein
MFDRQIEPFGPPGTGAKDRVTAIEMAGPYLAGKYRDYAKWGQDKVMPDNEDFTRSLDELIEGRFIIGSPEDCYNQLRPYWEEFGVNHIVVRTHWAGIPLSTALASIRQFRCGNARTAKTELSSVFEPHGSSKASD